MGVIRWGIRLFVAVAVVTFLTSLAVIQSGKMLLAQYGEADPKAAPARFAIVLSGGAMPDGVLNFSSRLRTRRAIELLQDGDIETLIFSGGGIYGPDRIAGGELMRRLALDSGAAEGQMLIEDRSLTTLENLRFSFAMIDELGAAHDGGDTMIVTSATHMMRTLMLARHLGRPDIRPGPVDVMGNLTFRGKTITAQREASAWWYNLGKVAVWEVLGLIGVAEEDRGRIVR